MNNKFYEGLKKLENVTFIKAIKNGLVSMIPVLTIGAFALIGKEFPIESYKEFINTFLNGFIYNLFDLIYTATFGVLSLYMTFLISRAYLKYRSDKKIVTYGAIVASMISFFILAGAYLPDFGLNSMGPKSMFLAIITGLGASELYIQLSKFFIKRRRMLFSRGADREFNRMLSTIFPILIVVATFAVLNELIILIFHVDSFRELLSKAFELLFSFGKVGFFKGFFFVLLSSVLWAFGIHGSDTLEHVMENTFTPGLAANQEAIANNLLPTNILTKEFFDCFVLMGGCGAAICLLIAILIFSKNRAKKRLGLTAAFPMIFNINELMVFGLPIVFNPIMIIPFLLTPLVCYSVSYLAISTGIVPMITNEVAWTTPVLLGGYKATGSIAGSLLQLFNIGIGVLIYLPFVKILDKQAKEESKRNYDDFMVHFLELEKSNIDLVLSEKNDIYGDFAKELCADLEYNYRNSIQMAYQPQYSFDEKIVGVEALLRYYHPEHGYLYPPLIIKLAEEIGLLETIEEEIFTRVLNDIPKIHEKFGNDIKISVNITGKTVINKEFNEFCKNLSEQYKFGENNLCIEITEKATLSFNQNSYSALVSLKELGFKLAIDDFSMGQTSLHYLKYDLFDIVKIDGSLVQGLLKEQHCKEIISSITSLASSLNLSIIAEFVDDTKQTEILHEIGCDIYQGFLYSQAVFLDEKQ